MRKLLNAITDENSEGLELPFSVYTSVKEQKILNVPIAKPLLIVVLDGEKQLGRENELVCHPGDFIFLSDNPAINMRNIPKKEQYFALLIEFDFQDFDGLQVNTINQDHHFIGRTTPTLEACLRQFIECSQWAPKSVWSLRKREIIEILCQAGNREVLSLLGSPKIKNEVHDMFMQNGFFDISTSDMCQKLNMSESTLRRKLRAEGTNVQEIKDQARLGLGFHLLQTTRQSIGLIADKCGYQSQSRFTDRFKSRFGLTPSELRKTKVTE